MYESATPRPSMLNAKQSSRTKNAGAFRSAANRGNELLEHFNSPRARIERACERHIIGRSDVHSHPDCDPLELPLTPAGLYENSREFPVLDVQIIGPLEPHWLRGEAVECASRPQPDSQRKHFESIRICGALDEGEPDSASVR